MAIHSSFFHIFILLLLLPCLSCRKYKSPIYDDPFYKNPSSLESQLNQEARKHHSRDFQIKQNSRMQPSANETYTEYKEKVLNTLHVQEQELRSIEERVRHKQELIENLEEEQSSLQAQHVSLRLKFLRVLSSDDPIQEENGNLFKRHLVENGETLQKISYRHYGTNTAWLAIYRFNRKQLPHGPNRIYPGQILYLPVFKKEL